VNKRGFFNSVLALVGLELTSRCAHKWVTAPIMLMRKGMPPEYGLSVCVCLQCGELRAEVNKLRSVTLQNAYDLACDKMRAAYR
jgi:hypothetical protein